MNRLLEWLRGTSRWISQQAFPLPMSTRVLVPIREDAIPVDLSPKDSNWTITLRIPAQ